MVHALAELGIVEQTSALLERISAEEAAQKIVDAQIDTSSLHDSGVAAAVALAPRIAAADIEAAHELAESELLNTEVKDILISALLSEGLLGPQHAAQIPKMSMEHAAQLLLSSIGSGRVPKQHLKDTRELAAALVSGNIDSVYWHAKNARSEKETRAIMLDQLKKMGAPASEVKSGASTAELALAIKARIGSQPNMPTRALLIELISEEFAGASEALLQLDKYVASFGGLSDPPEAVGAQVKEVLLHCMQKVGVPICNHEETLSKLSVPVCALLLRCVKTEQQQLKDPVLSAAMRLSDSIVSSNVPAMQQLLQIAAAQSSNGTGNGLGTKQKNQQPTKPVPDTQTNGAPPPTKPVPDVQTNGVPQPAEPQLNAQTNDSAAEGLSASASLQTASHSQPQAEAKSVQPASVAPSQQLQPHPPDASQGGTAKLAVPRSGPAPPDGLTSWDLAIRFEILEQQTAKEYLPVPTKIANQEDGPIHILHHRKPRRLCLHLRLLTPGCRIDELTLCSSGGWTTAARYPVSMKERKAVFTRLVSQDEAIKLPVLIADGNGAANELHVQVEMSDDQFHEMAITSIDEMLLLPFYFSLKIDKYDDAFALKALLAAQQFDFEHSSPSPAFAQYMERLSHMPNCDSKGLYRLDQRQLVKNKA
jgi:hypothetical protein